jgi:hypothetical protein
MNTFSSEEERSRIRNVGVACLDLRPPAQSPHHSCENCSWQRRTLRQKQVGHKGPIRQSEIAGQFQQRLRRDETVRINDQSTIPIGRNANDYQLIRWIFRIVARQRTFLAYRRPCELRACGNGQPRITVSVANRRKAAREVFFIASTVKLSASKYGKRETPTY